MRKTRRSDVILELIHRTKTAVKQLDNLQFRRLNKLLVNGANEEGVSDPASMVDVDDNSSIADDSSSHVEVCLTNILCFFFMLICPLSAQNQNIYISNFIFLDSCIGKYLTP